MESENWKEVDFHTYCPKCKYRCKSSIEDPCNECLTEGARINTKNLSGSKKRSDIL